MKGLRAVSDFESELQMAQMNRSLSGVETVFIPTSSSHSFIASRLLREVARYGGDVSPFVPAPVEKRLREKFAGEPRRDLPRRPRSGRRARRRPGPAAAEAPSDAESLLAPGDRGGRERQVDAAVELGARSRATRCSDLLDEALATLPDELKRARWVLADLDAMTEQRRREADALLDEVRAEAARLVSRTEIARQAKAHAERLVADAEERGRAILHEAEDFCDQRLAQMEIVLDRLQKTVQSGRERLRPRIEPEASDERRRRGRRRRVLRPGHRLVQEPP